MCLSQYVGSDLAPEPLPTTVPAEFCPWSGAVPEHAPVLPRLPSGRRVAV